MVFSHIMYSNPLVTFCYPSPILPDTLLFLTRPPTFFTIIGGEHSSIMHVWGPEDSLGDSIVSYHVGPWDQAQVGRLMPLPLLVTCWISL